VIRGVVVTLLVAGTAAAHARVNTTRRVEEGELWVPRPELARLASVGFQNLVSDYYWLQALQVVGSSTGDPTAQAPLLARLIDVVTTLDPFVGHPYRFAAVWLTDSEASVRKANALLEKGIEHHPDDWRNYYYLGFNLFFYLEQNEAAAAVLEKAASLPGSPKYLPRLVARLRAGGDGLDTSAAMLAALVQATQDPYEKAEYEKALDEIETERRARALDAARAEFQRRRGRDLTRVEELTEGPAPVLRALPPELHDWEWVIDPKTGRIVSSYYGARYEPLLQATARKERDRVMAAGSASKVETK
jgi:tetratricopeptide (TPR) repeat protein